MSWGGFSANSCLGLGITGFSPFVQALEVESELERDEFHGLLSVVLDHGELFAAACFVTSGNLAVLCDVASLDRCVHIELLSIDSSDGLIALGIKLKRSECLL